MHYQYVLAKGFKFQPDVCNWCHNVKMKSILSLGGVDSCCIINGISKSETVNVMQNADSGEKSGGSKN